MRKRRDKFYLSVDALYVTDCLLAFAYLSLSHFFREIFKESIR